jgi:hypothetical protein
VLRGPYWKGFSVMPQSCLRASWLSSEKLHVLVGRFDAGSTLTGIPNVSIVESMNTQDTGPNSEPSTPNAQDEQEPRPPDASSASGGVDGNEEPVVDMPELELTDLQRAMKELVESAQYLFGYILKKRSQRVRDDSDEEPANIAYGAAFEDAGAEEEPYVATAPGPFYNPFGAHDMMLKDMASSKRQEAGRHGFSMGLGLGSAVATMGVNAMIQDLIWGVGEMSADLGGVVRSAFGRRPVPVQVMRAIRHPRRIKWPPMPTSGDYDVTRMPVQESWGSFCRGSAPEAPAPSVPAQDQNEFVKKVMDLGEKVKAGTEQHEEVADVFRHFEELFSEFFPKKP